MTQPTHLHELTVGLLRELTENSTRLTIGERVAMFFTGLTPEAEAVVKKELHAILKANQLAKENYEAKVVADALAKDQWEFIGEGENGVRRMSVPGGWLYCTRIIGMREGGGAWSSWWSAPAFVPKGDR